MTRSALALVLAITAAPAAAQQSDPVLEDMKCFVASSAEGAIGSPDRVGLVLPFFIGKIAGRDPAFNADAVTTRYKAELDAILANEANAQRELARCNAEIAAATALLVQIPR